MCIIVLKNELRLNSIALLKASSSKERLDLLTQRSNLKDMLIEILERKAA